MAPVSAGIGLTHARTAVLHERDEIPDRGQSEANDHWILRLVDHLVDLAGVESLCHVNVRATGHRLAVLFPCELPLFARDRLPRRVPAVADGEPDAGIVGIDYQIRLVRAIRQVEAEALPIGNEIRTHPSLD